MRMVVEVDVVFYRGEKGEEILFKLEADELFGAHIAHGFGARGVGVIPGVQDGGCQEVYPAAVGGGEVEGVSE